MDLVDGFIARFENCGTSGLEENIFCKLTGMASGAYIYYEDDGDVHEINCQYGQEICEGIKYELYIG